MTGAPPFWLGPTILPDSESMHRLGLAIAATLRAGDLLVLTGPLGAGKTTLTRGLGAGLGVRGPVTSPTFVLARTHPSLVGGPPLVHVDAYRLRSALELDDLDIDFARSVVVVEWGRGMLEGIAESWLDVQIDRPRGGPVAATTDAAASVVRETEGTANPDDHDDLDPDDLDEPRTVTITAHGPRWASLSSARRP